MVNEFKKLFLAGLGSAAYTYEKASKLVDDMVEKGKLTIDEGKELSEELKRNFKGKVEEVKPLTKDDMISILSQMNFATKDDLKNIEQRLDTLEEKVNTKN
jgi:polyhydroxyalkanoate synthesis regulator phasin